VLLLWSQGNAGSRFAGEFLALGGGARALSLGSAYVALAEDVTAGYWNPAGLAYLPEAEAHLMHAERFSGLVQHDYLAIARPGHRLHGVALSLARVGVGSIPFTTLQDPGRPIGPENRPVISSTEHSADYALYLSAGHRLGRRLAAGASLKFIYRMVGSFSARGAGLDLGVRYRLLGRAWAAATIRDAVTTPVSWNTDATDRIHPSLLLGVACPVPLTGGRGTALVATRLGGDATPEGGGARLNLGVEYGYRFLAVRGGLDESHPAAGLGLRPHARLALDLAWLQHDDLEETYQLSATFRL
jgi:hypothetical protein